MLDLQLSIGDADGSASSAGANPNRTGPRPRPVTAGHQSQITNRNQNIPRGEGLMEKIDESLKTLLDQGREKGYLTYGQVNDYLPDNAVNPEKLDQPLILLGEQGIELIHRA